MTTQKRIDYLVSQIADLTNSATSKEQAIEKGLNKYLYAEYNNVYGGYRLVNVSVEHGGHSASILGGSTMPRQKAKVFELMLESAISALEYNK